MAKSGFTQAEAMSLAVFLKRVVARGAEEEQALLALVKKCEKIAAKTYNER